MSKETWFVYILSCADGTLYTGITKDIKERMQKHKSGTGAKYMRGRGPYKLFLSEKHPDKSSALKREAAIKKLRKADKLALKKKK